MKWMNRTDWWLLLSYLGLHLVVGIAFHLDLFDRALVKQYYFALPLTYTFFIYGYFYHRLWNNKVLMMWSTVGIIQLVVYVMFRENPELQTIRSNSLVWLKGLPITLLTYVSLSFINKKIYGDNYIVTTLRIFPNAVVKEDKRAPRAMDSLLSILGFMIILLVTILTP
jgi:hypothetical protein